jgi:hypothetical protein
MTFHKGSIPCCPGWLRCRRKDSFCYQLGSPKRLRPAEVVPARTTTIFLGFCVVDNRSRPTHPDVEALEDAHNHPPFLVGRASPSLAREHR